MSEALSCTVTNQDVSELMLVSLKTLAIYLLVFYQRQWKHENATNEWMNLVCMRAQDDTGIDLGDQTRAKLIVLKMLLASKLSRLCP